MGLSPKHQIPLTVFPVPGQVCPQLCISLFTPEWQTYILLCPGLRGPAPRKYLHALVPPRDGGGGTVHRAAGSLS